MAAAKAVVLYDGEGNPYAVNAGVAVALESTPGFLMMGHDGTSARALRVNAEGNPAAAVEAMNAAQAIAEATLGELRLIRLHLEQLTEQTFDAEDIGEEETP